MPSAPYHPIQEHADRLHDLEKGQGEICAELAVNSTKLQGLSDRVFEGFERIQEHLDVIHSKLDALGTSLGQHDDQIRDLTAAEDRRKGSQAWFKGVATTVAGAVSGAAIIKFLFKR